jgi:uncharacterized protein (DUF849 family)
MLGGDMLKAALNGSRDRAEHPALPVSPAELATAGAACVALGAGALHVHPRDAAGAESLEAAVVDAAVGAIRERCGGAVPVGVSTGAWIERDPARRVALVAAWTAPDFASVNLGEDAAPAVIDALLAAGIGVEAGVWSVADAERLARLDAKDHLTRVLVELIDVEPAAVPAAAAEIHATLDHHGIAAPRLQHGEGAATWPALVDAVARGLDTRAGLEDALVLPDGAPAPDNAALIGAARALGAA